MTIHTFEKNLTCKDSLKCSQSILTKIETPTLKLHADNDTDTVNGSVSINHIPKKHRIWIEIYDSDQPPNNEHASTFKKPSQIPTRTQLEALL